MRFKDSPLLWLVVGGLATWRITSIVQREGIAQPVRERVGIQEFGDDPDYWIYPDNFLGNLLRCFWCGSVWAGAAVTLMILVFPPSALLFAYSALAILLDNWMNKPENTDIEGGIP